MQFHVTGHNLELSDAVRDYAKEQMGKLTHHFPDLITAHITINLNNLTYLAEMTVGVPKDTVHTHAESDNMYKAIELMINKMHRQLIKHKDKH